MNGYGDRNAVCDCPISSCRWASAPLPTVEAALEARRKHLSEFHSHGDLVEHIASNNRDKYAEYVLHEGGRDGSRTA